MHSWGDYKNQQSVAVLVHAGSVHGAPVFTVFTLIPANGYLLLQIKLAVSCLPQIISTTEDKYLPAAKYSQTLQQVY